MLISKKKNIYIYKQPLCMWVCNVNRHIINIIYIYTLIYCTLRCEGSTNLLEEHLIRVRGSLKELAQLGEIPLVESASEVTETLRAMRKTPMENEKALLWACQDGEDTSTRRLLPDWVADPVGKFVMKWIDENSRWQKVAQERGKKNKDMTECQKQGYEEFQQFRSQCKFLFDKERESAVYKLPSKAALKTVQTKMFSLKVVAETMEGDFTVQCGNGAPQTLVLLRSEAIAQDVPPCLFDMGVAPDVMEEAMGGGIDCGENEEVDAMDVSMIDQAEAVQLCHGEADVEEICGNTSDEEDILQLKQGDGFKRVKTFCFRQSYKDLEMTGLTMLPVHRQGVYLSFHGTTSTWQSYYPIVPSGIQMAFTFGGTSKRSLLTVKVGSEWYNLMRTGQNGQF